MTESALTTDPGRAEPHADTAAAVDATVSQSQSSGGQTSVPPDGGAKTDIRGRHMSRATLVKVARGQGLLVMLVGLIVYFAIRSEYFLNWDNFLIIASSSAALGIMAVTQTYLVVSGGVDLSPGATLSLTGIVFALAEKQGFGFWSAAGLALGCALLVGLANGVITVVFGITPLITTLGTLSIASGIAYTLAAGQTYLINDPLLASLGSGKLGDLPVAFVLFLVVLVVAIVFERFTAGGRNVYALGGNPEAARLAGIRIRMTPFVLYLVSALSAGVAGLIVAGSLSAASPDVGSSYLLSVVTAVILGGTSLAGGRGSVIGTLVAIGILGVLQNGFALLSLSSNIQTTALGIALIVAVLLDSVIRRVERR
jgi:ribose transport system permease protein